MNKYRVLVNGRNFLIEINGVMSKHGFYTTRYVEAADPDAAELVAMDLVRQRRDIASNLKNVAPDLPMMYAEEIEELDDFEKGDSSNHGFSWYIEEEVEGDAESEEIYEARITNHSSLPPEGGD